jgi:hypothetical protein
MKNQTIKQAIDLNQENISVSYDFLGEPRQAVLIKDDSSQYFFLKEITSEGKINHYGDNCIVTKIRGNQLTFNLSAFGVVKSVTRSFKLVK